MSGTFKDGAYYPLGCGEPMSEGSYQALLEDAGPDPIDDDPPPSLETPRGEWRTRDGRTLKVKDMADGHIENVIKLFTKAGWGSHDKIDEFRRALSRRSRRPQ